MIRGRFAPSPTGELHLGNARTALLAWLQIRKLRGRFVLRVEDLDPLRSRPEFVDAQLDELRWLGIDWDEGPDVGGPHEPYFQSQRSDLYAEALGSLASQGLIYPCTCSRREIADAASAPHGEEGPVYPGTCRYRGRQLNTRPDALRLQVPDDDICFEDVVLGPQSFNPARETGDFVVRRKDGVASYQLAVTVDDADMEITHVLRGADLLSSTARQLLIYSALDFRVPEFSHVPLLLGPDGDRLSKRHGPVGISRLRQVGVDSDAIIGWLGYSAGLLERPVPTSAETLIDRFDPSRIRDVGANLEDILQK